MAKEENKEELAAKALNEAVKNNVASKDKPLEEQKDEEINLLQYTYPEDSTEEIPSSLFEALIQVLAQVRDNETSVGFISAYPEKSRVNKDKEGKVSSVEVSWENYPTIQSYFSQSPHEIRSMVGVAALDLLTLLQGKHLENIRAGKAKKIGTIDMPKIKL